MDSQLIGVTGQSGTSLLAGASVMSLPKDGPRLKAASRISQHRLGSRGTLLRTFSEVPVTIVSATEARRRLYALIDEVGQSHQPVQIHGKRGNAVLISEADWRSIEETLHLLAIPGMRESILEGMATEASELSSEPGW